MKKIIIIQTLLLICVLVSTGFSQHYYGNNQQIPLYIDSTKVTIKFEPSIVGFDQEGILNSIDRIEIAYINDDVIDNFVVCSLTTSTGYSAFIDSLRSINGIDFVEPYYTNIDSSAMLVGTRFYTAFDSSLSVGEIDSICANFPLL